MPFQKSLSQDEYCFQSACEVKFACCYYWNIYSLTLDLRVITYSVTPWTGFQAFCAAGIQGAPNHLDLNIKEDTLRPLYFSLYFSNWFHIISFFRCTWASNKLERGALRHVHSYCSVLLWASLELLSAAVFCTGCYVHGIFSNNNEVKFWEVPWMVTHNPFFIFALEESFHLTNPVIKWRISYRYSEDSGNCSFIYSWWEIMLTKLWWRD